MFELLDACIEDAKHPLKPSMKIHAVDDLPPPLTAAYQPYPFKLEPNYAYGPDTSVPDGVDEPHLNEAQTEALKEHFRKKLMDWREDRKNELASRVVYDQRRAWRRGHDAPATPAQHKLGQPSTTRPSGRPTSPNALNLSMTANRTNRSTCPTDGSNTPTPARAPTRSPTRSSTTTRTVNAPFTASSPLPQFVTPPNRRIPEQRQERARVAEPPSPSRFSRMPHAWLHLVEYVQPSLNELLDHFVCLYTALENKDGYQSWFADWWKWWTKQGLGNTADVAPYNARWYFSHVERTRMLELLGAFIEDAQRADNDKHKIRSVQDLEHKWTEDKHREVEKSSKFHKKKMRMSRGNVPEETHKPGRAATQAPFKTPNIAECARLVHEGKPLEPEYMPDEPVHHPHASSSANSLAHTLLHQYSHRQRAIYGL
ncbi:Proteophosphoglycan ppg4 [Rhodotorula toruloides]|nr:Proteophosphoglycan ppg4 [Rhodotorula toruloides]